MLKTLTGWDKTAIMNGVDSHVTNCDNMFLKYDNGINKIRQMTTDTTANCVEAEEEKERDSTLSNNLKPKNENSVIVEYTVTTECHTNDIGGNKTMKCECSK